jgi:hypothetical protein
MRLKFKLFELFSLNTIIIYDHNSYFAGFKIQSIKLYGVYQKIFNFLDEIFLLN